MALAIEMEGQTFGQLTVLYRTNPSPRAKSSRVAYWLCECECGNRKAVMSTNLRSGKQISCGCKRGRPRKKVETEIIN